ncbi:MAG: xanthine dehydrogenase family protein subunit M [Spirochaetaceae bacterium]|nr:MAG: xanthine dehydrogenase family protein subunit M [Spirochaetaceae bacterium]
MGDFRFFRPTALEELLDFKAREGSKARILDGGSNVLVYIKEGSIPGGTLVDVKFLETIKGIQVRDGRVEIGAGELIANIMESPLIEKQVPFLRDVLQKFANPLVRNMATLAGNIADSSPIGDTIPPLMVLRAEVVVASTKGTRAIPLEEFFTGPGKNVLKPEEVILKVHFPIPKQGSGGHIKLGLRRGTSCSVASVAVWVVAVKNKVEDIRIALGGVAPTPIRAPKTESAFKGQSLEPDRIAELSERVMEEISPISDVRGSAEYRRQVSARLLAKAVRQALGMEE